MDPEDLKRKWEDGRQRYWRQMVKLEAVAECGHTWAKVHPVSFICQACFPVGLHRGPQPGGMADVAGGVGGVDGNAEGVPAEGSAKGHKP